MSAGRQIPPGHADLAGAAGSARRAADSGRQLEHGARRCRTASSRSPDVTPGQYRVDGARASSARRSAGRGAAAAAPPARTSAGRGGRGGPGSISRCCGRRPTSTSSGQNVTDLVLSLQPGMTITGRVSFEGTTLPPPTDLTRVRVNLAHARHSSCSNGRCRAAGAGRCQRTLHDHRRRAGTLLDQRRRAGRRTGRRRVRAAPATRRRRRHGRRERRRSGSSSRRSPADATSSTSRSSSNRTRKSAAILMTFSDRTQELSGTIQDATGQADGRLHDHRLPGRQPVLAAAVASDRLRAARHRRQVHVPQSPARRLSPHRRHRRRARRVVQPRVPRPARRTLDCHLAGRRRTKVQDIRLAGKT